MSVTKYEVNTYTIECYESGKEFNQAIVFVHGLGSNYRQWKRQLAFFEKSYHVIAFSFQGHGESSDNVSKPYAIEDYIQTATELLDLLGISDCIWVGNSMGGVIGYGVLQRRSELIRHLITNGTTPEIKMAKSLLNMVKIMDQFLIKLMGFWGYIKFAAKHSTQSQEVVEEIYDLFQMTSPETIITSHQILGDYSYIAFIENGTKPITIIKSPKDRDINRYLKKQRAILTNENHVTIVELTDSGHMCNLEKPEAYNQLVRNIINNSSVSLLCSYQTK